MAEETSVFVNMSDMIDLAIGTPEVGVVDFNMLQTVLHCFAQQMRCLSKNVELRGSFAALPLFRDNAQTVAVYEFAVDIDDNNMLKKEQLPSNEAKDKDKETMLVVERVRKNEPRSPSDETEAPGAERSIPASIAAGRHPMQSVVTTSKFNLLEEAVTDLKKRVYGTLEDSQEILDEVRSQTNARAITDMWAQLNVQARLDAAETGVATLSSLIEELMKQIPGVGPELIERLPLAKAPSPESPYPTPGLEVSKEKFSNLKKEVNLVKLHLLDTQAELEALCENFYNAVPGLKVNGEKMELSKERPDKTDLPRLDLHLATPAPGQTEDPGLFELLKPIKARLCECERGVKKNAMKIGKGEDMVNDQMSSFQDQLEGVSKQQAEMLMEDGKLSPDLLKNLEGLVQLFETVHDMQQQLSDVHETALQLAAEKEARQHHLNSLIEQVELLKIVKLDREDMLEALADKADNRLLARKVSHDQFEVACDDLSKGLEHALGKLNMQEALWQQALDDIQREIETKLDKMELSPVKDFFNNKLRQLQESLKQMADLRREAEAAGTKRRILRDVNCISCDANAVMQMEQGPALPSGKPLPPNLSMKPFLTYELDTIRKQRASSVPQRNMHDWETMDKQMTHPRPLKNRVETDKHICNRYCGGSHTMTTPAQRIARFGHFMKQWGPDVLPLSTAMVPGDDGRMYKVNPDAPPAPPPAEAAKTPSRKSDVRPPSKPIVIATECRCIDGAAIDKIPK